MPKLNCWFTSLRCIVPLGAAALALPSGPASAAPLQDPPVFASQGGSLSVLMVAAERPGTKLGPVTTAPWTYEVCNLPSPTATACPSGSPSGLGAVRLAIQPGDTLRVRLVNNLPLADGADHVADNCYLYNNPTNIHTHGLIVEPHRAVGPTDTYGDYVFLELDNAKNQGVPRAADGTVPTNCQPLLDPKNPGKLLPHAHPGNDLALQFVNYLYKIEPQHPSGLYWFHPHLHGISLPQVNAGLAGMITVGNPADECGDAACKAAVAASNVRHMILKDTQVYADGKIHVQPSPSFCDGAPATPARQGTCPGQNLGPGADYTGGTWVHTVNGQVYPSIDVGPGGDLWRIVNAGGSRSYELSLNDAKTGQALPVQLIAIDGLTINVAPGTSLAQMSALMGGKAKVVACPSSPTGRVASLSSEPVCATSLRMMPSARVQVRVLRGDSGGAPLPAVFRTAEYATGDTLGTQSAGDHWPQIDLASVTLAPANAATPKVVGLAAPSKAALSSTGQLSAPTTAQVPGTANLVNVATAGSALTALSTGPALQPQLLASSTAVTPSIATGKTASPGCTPLPFGHHRKILFGYPTKTSFGLGYVEVDLFGRDLEATRIPIQEYDPKAPVFCIPVPAGGSAFEVWELVNLTSEDHNFHIHQTRFLLLAGGTAAGTSIVSALSGNIVLHDNVPMPRPTPAANALACDGTFATVQSGACKPSSTFVGIPFREIGDFVFHCHILEHEDGGMMSRLRVVAAK